MLVRVSLYSVGPGKDPSRCQVLLVDHSESMEDRSVLVSDRQGSVGKSLRVRAWLAGGRSLVGEVLDCMIDREVE